MTPFDLRWIVRGAARARAGETLSVRVGQDIVRIPSGTILEIMDPVGRTRLPGAPAEVLGVVNHRGTPVPVIDLGRALGSDFAAEPYRLVVLTCSGRTIALAVDDVLSFVDGGGEDGADVVDLEGMFGEVFGGR